ncbi:hypothetical protein [Nocardia sp. NPDC052566]|uniref:hypothetical protein n=1 Tax=Nocardia sp. NPDC052566 TaxID=3364330 RepID=UPI0037CA2E4B
MTRTTAAIAVCATAFALLLSGCGEDKSTGSGSSPASSSANASTSAAKPGDSTSVDNLKTSSFVVSFKGAFPKLAEGKDDKQIGAILTETCKDIKGGKSEDDAVKNIIGRTKTGSTEASKEEAQAIYVMAKLLC